MIFSEIQRFMNANQRRRALANARLASVELQQRSAEREETMREIAQLQQGRSPREDEPRET